jgi:hypothetical protein
VDSLANLASGLIPVFEAERARLLVLRLEAPSDTRVPVQTGRLQLTARTSHRANVVLSIASGDAVVRHDSQTVAGTAILEWDLRTDDGAVISPGEYVLRINASDSLGEVASAFEAIMTIEPATGDTQPLPPPLDPSAFAPESVTVLSQRQPKALVRGLVLGAATAFLSSLGPSGKDNPDPKAVAVGGALAVVGIVGFFTEGAVTRPLRDNIQRNRELRERDAQGRATIIHANAQTRLAPPLRIRIQGTDK